MSQAVSLKTIVRDYPEPQRTEILRKLKGDARAFILTYRPRKDAPAHRRERLVVSYGIPTRRIVFDAGKPKACDLGLATHVLDQYCPRPHKVDRLAWGDEWEVDDSDPIIVEKLPDSARDAMEARERARQRVADEKRIEQEDDPEDDDGEGPEDDDTGDGSTPLSRMNKGDLVLVFEAEIGHAPTGEDFQDGKVTISNLLEAIRSNRKGAEDDPEDDDGEGDPTEPVE